MWWCNDCEDYFDEPEVIKDEYGYEFCICPKCHQDDVEECKDKCDVCGEITHETSWIGNLELCPDCVEKAGKLMNEFADKLVGELDIDRLDAQELITNWFC